jgi:two-component system sensor histidine kinase TctE
MAEPRSLRSQLLRRLIVPVAFLIALNAGFSYYVGSHYANVAFDRWLLDSARSLAQEVKAQHGKVSFELSPTALEVFEWDETDKTYFRIESAHLGFMAGDRIVPEPPDRAAIGEQPGFYDQRIGADPVRVVAMVVRPAESAEEVLVQVAETVNKRRNMMRDILLVVLVPQLLMVAVAMAYLWKGIDRGLRPLRELTRQIAQRSPRDLAPIPDSGVPLEVRGLTDTINDLLQRVALGVAAQHRFVANAAHQLRTPLAGLKVQAERALRERDLAAMEPALVRIKDSADRVAHLSSQLLTLARAEPAAEGAGAFQPVDLEALAKDACMDWVPKALERNIDLSFEGPGRPVWIRGDETLLRELLNNLLDNAIRYGRQGGQVTVRLEAGPAAGLAVEDDGPGIPESERSRIFERFYRIPGSPGEGCGLGLAIVREIGDLHRARVRLERPACGEGTRVEVRFDSAG